RLVGSTFGLVSGCIASHVLRHKPLCFLLPKGKRLFSRLRLLVMRPDADRRKDDQVKGGQAEEGLERFGHDECLLDLTQDFRGAFLKNAQGCTSATRQALG